jgi:septation ring formation regulator EzrA
MFNVTYLGHAEADAFLLLVTIMCELHDLFVKSNEIVPSNSQDFKSSVGDLGEDKVQYSDKGVGSTMDLLLETLEKEDDELYLNMVP